MYTYSYTKHSLTHSHTHMYTLNIHSLTHTHAYTKWRGTCIFAHTHTHICIHTHTLNIHSLTHTHIIHTHTLNIHSLTHTHAYTQWRRTLWRLTCLSIQGQSFLRMVCTKCGGRETSASWRQLRSNPSIIPSPPSPPPSVGKHQTECLPSRPT